MKTLATLLAVTLLAASPVHAERTNTDNSEVAFVWAGLFTAGLFYHAFEDDSESD